MKEYLHKWLNSKKGTDYYLRDIDKPLIRYLLKELTIPVLAILLGLSSILILKDIKPFLYLLLISLLFIYMIAKEVKDIFSQDIIRVTGVFLDDSLDYDDEESFLANKFRIKFLRRSIRLILPDKSVVIAYPAKSFRAETGNEVAVYCYANSLRNSNNDTIIISKHLSICITKSISDLELID